jgi:hypothetical protein
VTGSAGHLPPDPIPIPRFGARAVADRAEYLPDPVPSPGLGVGMRRMALPWNTRKCSINRWPRHAADPLPAIRQRMRHGLHAARWSAGTLVQRSGDDCHSATWTVVVRNSATEQPVWAMTPAELARRAGSGAARPIDFVCQGAPRRGPGARFALAPGSERCLA